ncbi:hypothetical protein HGP17_28110 [Rhizobium sp. P38BS-XIX]|uniref:hypothetical protein n=1 Tax=Rhizobium sp. P38BS-XIX TaxID=2726740 RepID=UPI001456450E|nr:hypothetical protein [Rhizobium sp. P38BS-XIX]NLS00712.1 hypothetical protein [Rhizobium sp. P38BS-XIX]
MKVLAIGSIVKPLSDEQRNEIMPKEVPATLKHYLESKIEQFWYRQDAPGVVFLMNVDSVDQARAEVGTLPLVTGGFATYEFMPLGPLAPLGLLIQGK